jgi:hypothetical protein
MAASVTKTEITHKPIKKITWAWTAHTDGKVAAATTNAETTNYYTGTIERLVTVPGTLADQPDDNYDVYVYDDDSVDVLLTGGLNRDETNTEQVAASSLGIVCASKLTLYVEGAGSGLKGTVHLYIRG